LSRYASAAREPENRCEAATEPTGYRSWSDYYTSPKDEKGNWVSPVSGWDSAKSGLGCSDNRHLNRIVEAKSVNVRGSNGGGEQATDEAVRASEASYYSEHGKAVYMGKDARGESSRRIIGRSLMKFRRRKPKPKGDEPEGNFRQGVMSLGEPDAWKSCTSGSAGGVGRNLRNYRRYCCEAPRR
jgi:hypothetical protein